MLPAEFKFEVKPLVAISGLDIDNCTYHSSLFAALVDKLHERAISLNYKFLSPATNRKSGSPGQVLAKSRGILKYNWPNKYLEKKPSALVCFIDVQPDVNLIERRSEWENKITLLKRNLPCQETRLVAVMICTSTCDDSLEDLSKCLKLPQKQIFKLHKNDRIPEFIAKFERSLHEISSEAYQAFLKKIRSKNVPNNDPFLLISQQYKLAFISELRQDSHSALRYYKQAYHYLSELAPDNDNFEILTVSSLLNYKICELLFNSNSVSDAISQIRKHENTYFARQIGTYPSKELAEIEFALWKSQQSRLFAELFCKAVQKGLSGYSFQNPGRFLSDAANYQRSANVLIRRLKFTSSADIDTDKEHINEYFIDLNAPTEFIGQRPWKADAHPHSHATSVFDDIHLEHTAKIYLEKKITENYTNSVNLSASAISQFKKYNCNAMQQISLIRMADDYIYLHQYSKAHQLLSHVLAEVQTRRFHSLVARILVRLLLTSYCTVNFNDYVSTLNQLLHPSFLIDKYDSTWLTSAQNFISSNFNAFPFFIPLNNDGLDETLLRPDFQTATHQWQHLLSPSSNATKQLFLANMTNINEFTSVHCIARLLSANLLDDDEMISPMQIAYSGRPLLVQIELLNVSPVSIHFGLCQVFIETGIQGSRKEIILTDWLSDDCDVGINQQAIPIHLTPNSSKSLYFVITPTLEHANISCSFDNYVIIRRFVLWTNLTESTSTGCFVWEFPQQSNLTVGISPDCHSLRLMPAKLEMQIECCDEVLLFLRESIIISFTLLNSCTNSIMKRVRVISHLLNDSDELHNSPAVLKLHSDYSSLIQTRTKMQPVFDCEVVDILPYNEQATFSITLQPSTEKYKCLVIHTSAILENEVGQEEYGEMQKNIPVICSLPFESEAYITSLDNEVTKTFVNGQFLYIHITLKPSALKPLTVLSLDWNINNILEGPLNTLPCLQSIFDPIMPAYKTDDSLIRHSVLVKVPSNLKSSQNFAMGNCVINWRGIDSLDVVETVIELGEYEFTPIPFTIDTELISHNDDVSSLVIRKPFVIRFTLQNFSDEVISLHIIFDPSDVFVFAGSKELNLRLYPGFTRSIDQTYVALAAGLLTFPSITIKCTDVACIDHTRGNNLVYETNRLIQMFAHKSLPQSLFVMP